MKIRNYEPADKAKIISIYDNARRSELLLAGAVRGFVSLEDPETFDFLSLSKILVAEISERIAGFVAYDKDTIGWLYVNPVHAHEGIGTALAKRAMMTSRRSHHITLETSF